MAKKSIASRFQRQLRAFAFVWTGITVAMSALTFVAVYMTYGALNPTPALASANDELRQVELPDPASVNNAGAMLTTTPSPRAATLVPTADSTALGVDYNAMAATVTAMVAARDANRPPTDAAPIEAPTSDMPPTLRPVDDTRFQLGVQVQVSYDIMDQWMLVAADQLDVNWVKQQVRWEDIETEPDVYDWTTTDIYLPSANAKGLKVLISVVTAPDWAREPGVTLTRHGPPADYAEYAEFLRDLLERYPNMVHAVEVWNEQNLDREWTSTGGLSAANYVRLLQTAHTVIKAVDSGIIVVSGALAPTGLSDGVRAWDDFTYFDQMVAAGLLNYTDCVGAHHNGINLSPAYTWDAVPNDPTATFRGPFDNPHHSWSFRSTLQTYANKIQLAGGDQKLCVTEFGWPSAEGLAGIPQGFDFARDNTLEEQRDFTVLALDFMRGTEDVQLAFLWNLNYGPQAGWAADNDNVAYSIIGPGSQFRPVFDAVRDWNRAYEAEVAP